MSEDKLKLLRTPFDENLISKLPKPTRAQTDAVKKDFRSGQRCRVCGGWHHPDVVHLDYVGHAALTDRLLDVDPMWSWEPLSLNESGLPAMDNTGGLWIKLTVCGMTRIGYGDADGKTGGNAVKECIGDALRNAAMRFGAALDLWHKGDLHLEEGATQDQGAAANQPANLDFHIESIKKAYSMDSLKAFYQKAQAFATKNNLDVSGVVAAKNARKIELEQQA